MWKRHRIILFVDHGGIRVLEDLKKRKKSPRDLMRLAEIRGKVVDARLFTDMPRLGVSNPEKERHVREWEDAGFTVVACGRTGDASGENGRTKESIDVRLIEAVHKELQKIDHAASWHFIFVVGDADFRPVIQTLLRQGIRTSVFLTTECALLQSTLAKQLFEIYALFDPGDDSRFQTLGPVMHNYMHLGTLRDRYVPTDKQQDVLDRVMGATMVCARCGEEIPFDEYVRHPCNPGRKYFFHCTDPGSGPGNAGLLTEEYAAEIVEFLEGAGAKEFFRWYAARVKDGVCEHELAYILSRVSRMRRTVVETSLILGELAKHPEGWESVDARAFSVGTVRMDACLNYGIVEEVEGRMYVPEALKAGLGPLAEEANRRIGTLMLSRMLMDNDVFRANDLRPKVFKSPDARAENVRAIEAELAEALAQQGSLSDKLRALSSDAALYWITRDECGRPEEELEAAKAIAASGPSCALSMWIPIVRNLPKTSPTPQDGLFLANEIAKVAVSHMTERSMDILIGTGVLIQDEDALVRGRLSHPAFTSFAPSAGESAA